MGVKKEKPTKDKVKNNWSWSGQQVPIDFDFSDYYGFVYLIEDLTTGKSYVGEKSFWSFVTVDGKVNKKKIESNWREYTSSNKELSTRIKKTKDKRNDNFKFTILSLCTDQSIMKYEECKMMMILGAMTTDKFYNANIKINIMCSYKDYNKRVFINPNIKDVISQYVS